MVTYSVKLLLFIHMGISLGGVLVHSNIHPVGESMYYWWASPLSAFSLVVIPLLLSRPSTAGWGFMFNAGVVLIGTIGMLYYSLLNLERPLTMYKVMIESTLPGILILWAKVPIAYFILLKVRPSGVPRRERGCKE